MGVAPKPDRVIGYDVARSCAMLGMIVVHFSLVAATDRTGPAWMAFVLNLLDGRAAALFVTLAGVGVAMMARRAVASGDPAELAKVQCTLVRRGLFLLVIGFLNLTIWAGDILRVYGVSLLLISQLLRAPSRLLLRLAAAFAAGFVALMLVADFEKNWDWATLTYSNLWTPGGVVRNLFFDGFRSVFPWTGFLLYGMWLGRLDLADPRVGNRVLAVAAATAVGTEVFARGLVAYLMAHRPAGLDDEAVKYLFGTESMPALPLFLVAAGATATAVIAACVRLTTAWPGRGWAPLVAIGQMALTWYFAHIVVGLGTLVALGVVGTEPLPTAAGYGVLFFALAVGLSVAWKSFARHGPLEWVMRKVAG